MNTLNFNLVKYSFITVISRLDERTRTRTTGLWTGRRQGLELRVNDGTQAVAVTQCRQASASLAGPRWADDTIWCDKLES
jgi:hypothetical protein